MAPDTPDAAKQIQLIKTAIRTGVDAIAIDATAAEALKPLIESIIKDGTPVVTYTSQVEGIDGILGHFGPDDAAEARQWADAMAEYAGPGGQVAVIEGIPGHPQLSKRIDAMKEQMASEHPDVDFVGSFAGSFDVAKQAALVESLLKKYPDLKVIGGQEFVSSEAIANVLKREGLEDQIAGVTFDLSPTTIAAVKDGSLKWITGEDLYHEGYDATAALAQFLEDGTEPEEPVNNTDKCFPDETLCADTDGIYTVDADNVDAFLDPKFLDAYKK
jgi:ABC-type sugar transport system substrate-binding protein